MDSSQDKPLKRLQEQKAGLENALVLAPAEDKVRLRQQIEDLDQQILDRIATIQNDRSLQIGIAERQEQANDRVRVLVVTANPLGSTPLQLDREVKTIDEALRRSRKRNNFEVEYRLAATPSELRRALLDVEPHILHFSGHGAGEQGLLFVSDESAGSLYRSEGGEVRANPSQTNEIRFVPAEPLAKLLGLCEEHLECVVLNACYSDVQANAIAAYIPITIGTRDQINDNVAIKFTQGFYDAIGAGKGYEKAFEWGKVAIEFDLANYQSTDILILRKKGDRGNQTRSSFELPNSGGTLELIAVPGGTLVMKGGHRVNLKPFLMGKYAITQRQYQSVMGENPSYFTGDLERPVETVSWNDAIAFCQKLSDLLGQTIDLPSETQWEWAARGATKSQGYTYAGSNNLDEVGWYWENSGDKRLSDDSDYNEITQNNCRTHPVGQKQPNELGLYDMSGNVWEWCKDNWTDDANVLPQDGTALTQGGDSGWCAVRGGSWILNPESCRCAWRFWCNPGNRSGNLGFRVLLSISSL